MFPNKIDNKRVEQHISAISTLNKTNRLKIILNSKTLLSNRFTLHFTANLLLDSQADLKQDTQSNLMASKTRI